MVQDNTDNNVQDLKNQLAAERLKEQQQAAMLQHLLATLHLQPRHLRSRPQLLLMVPPASPFPAFQASRAPQTAYGQQNAAQPQLTPVQQQAQQLAAKERELAYNARFASNLAYVRASRGSPRSHADRTNCCTGGYRAPSRVKARQSPLQRRAALLRLARQANRSRSQPIHQLRKHAAEVNIDSAVGQPYVIYEGLTMDTVLMNRLDGDAVGPVKVLVSNPVYSHDRQHVLIPEGTIVLGEARKIGSSGFGQQRRMAVVFHRMIMPDGYSVDLDQFHGLDQIGEEGLKDKVNNHYLQIFGTSIALGVIAGAGQITQGGSTFGGSGSQQFTNGAASSVSQSATTILDRFMQIPPTITIREGHRVKVYFTQDMLLPAYENHTIPQTF